MQETRRVRHKNNWLVQNCWTKHLQLQKSREFMIQPETSRSFNLYSLSPPQKKNTLSVRRTYLKISPSYPIMPSKQQNSNIRSRGSYSGNESCLESEKERTGWPWFKGRSTYNSKIRHIRKIKKINSSTPIKHVGIKYLATHWSKTMRA